MATNINSRVFGSDIPKDVKRILESRQIASTRNIEPNESITTSGSGTFKPSDYIRSHFSEHTLDLSSRTAFARMWTSVDLVEKVEPADDEGWEVVYTETDVAASSDESAIKTVEKDLETRHANKITGWQELYSKENVKHYNVIDNSDPDKPKVTFYAAVQKDIYKAKQNFGQKIYMLNTHQLNTFDAEPGESLQQARKNKAAGSLTEEDKAILERNTLFPDEHLTSTVDGDGNIIADDNQYMKPAAGITNVTSETEGNLGVIRKTTVNFKVHNFHDFDRIYNRYFLRPGAQLFIDFGWSDLISSEHVSTVGAGKGAELYDPEFMLDESKGFPDNTEGPIIGGIQNKLFGDGIYNKYSYIGHNQGLCDTVVGLVTDYNASIQEDGSVECSVTITSKNAALLEYNMKESEWVFKRIEFILEYLLFFEGYYQGLNDNDKKYIKKDIGGGDPSVEHIGATSEGYVNFLDDLGVLLEDSILASDSLTPGSEAVASGIFISKKFEKKYINWGLFEDRVLNSEFGFGSSIDDINSVTKGQFQVNIDSSNSTVTWMPEIFNRQGIIAQFDDENPPKVLIPKEWDKTYNTLQGKQPSDCDEDGYTYQTFVRAISLGWGSGDKSSGKFVESGDLTQKRTFTTPGPGPYDKPRKIGKYGPKLSKAGGGWVGYTGTDQFANRIPLREIFVDVEVLKKAFSANNFKSVRRAVESILNTLSEDVTQIWDLQLVSAPGDDSSLSVTDYNMLGIESQGEEDVYDKLFVFDVMSENSIVKGYDVQLSIPDGDIGNMYAIQGSSGTTQMIPASSLMDQNLAMHSLTGNFKNYMVRYLPDVTTYRTDRQNFDESNRSAFEGNFGALKLSMYEMIGGRADYSDGLWKHHGDADSLESQLLFIAEKRESDEKNASKNNKKTDATMKIIEANDDDLRSAGFTVCDRFSEYFKQNMASKFFAGALSTKRATPFPMTLTLTTYGISSLQPGDIFRVNYLPEVYRKNVYFQVIKVIHNIGTDGWYTTLETQFRVRPDKKDPSNLFSTSAGTFLSCKILEKSYGKKVYKQAINESNVDTKNNGIISNYRSPQEMLDAFVGGETQYIGWYNKQGVGDGDKVPRYSYITPTKFQDLYKYISKLDVNVKLTAGQRNQWKKIYEFECTSNADKKGTAIAFPYSYAAGLISAGIYDPWPHLLGTTSKAWICPLHRGAKIGDGYTGNEFQFDERPTTSDIRNTGLPYHYLRCQKTPWKCPTPEHGYPVAGAVQTLSSHEFKQAYGSKWQDQQYLARKNPNKIIGFKQYYRGAGPEAIEDLWSIFRGAGSHGGYCNGFHFGHQKIQTTYFNYTYEGFGHWNTWVDGDGQDPGVQITEGYMTVNPVRKDWKESLPEKFRGANENLGLWDDIKKWNKDNVPNYKESDMGTWEFWGTGVRLIPGKKYRIAVPRQNPFANWMVVPANFNLPENMRMGDQFLAHVPDAWIVKYPGCGDWSVQENDRQKILEHEGTWVAWKHNQVESANDSTTMGVPGKMGCFRTMVCPPGVNQSGPGYQCRGEGLGLFNTGEGGEDPYLGITDYKKQIAICQEWEDMFQWKYIDPPWKEEGEYDRFSAYLNDYDWKP